MSLAHDGGPSKKLPKKARPIETIGLLCAFIGLAVLKGVGCSAPPTARAYRTTDRAQLVGGPSAIGEVGDFILENDRIRAVVLEGGNSVGPGMFGGTIVDADIRRPETSHSAGRGNDQFSELFPMVNLVIPGYDDESTGGIGDLAVEVWSQSGDDRCPLSPEQSPHGCASIRVSGKGDRIIEALGTVEMLNVAMQLSFVSYYILQPGDNYITVRTFFWDEGAWSLDEQLAGSAEEPHELARLAAESPLAPLQESIPIFDALVGDALDTNPEECVAEEGDEPPSCYQHPGYLAGDFLMFGKNLHPFGTSDAAAGTEADRSGFDLPYLFQRRYDQGEVVLASPLANNVLIGAGHGVSYGYLSAQGTVVLPILTGSFSGAFTHVYQCESARVAESCGDAIRRPMMYDRYLVIGDGDAASVLETYYRLTGLPTGRVSGHVFDAQTSEPCSHADVFALLDPRVQPDGTLDTSSTEVLRSYDALAAAVREAFDDNPSIVSFATADPGIDHVPDASWSMELEPGHYVLVPFEHGRRPGQPVPITVAEGDDLTISLALPPPGRLHYEIFDEHGELATAKLTLIGPLEDDATCPTDLPAPRMSELRYLELGMSERPSGIAAVIYADGGRGEVELAPGRYDAIASRGFEYSIDRRCLTIRQDTAPVEEFLILREVDTTGWVAGDFHVHGVNSYDGSMPHRTRVTSAVAEGIEVFSTSDHDYITNLQPVINDMDMRDEVHAMVGVEITPIETGHLLGYPLRFDETQVDNGAPDWTRRDRCLVEPDSFGCPGNDSGYLALTPEEMFDAIRELGEFGPDHTVVTVPHPRDGFFGYFDQFGINHFDLSLDPAGFVSGQNPVLRQFDVDNQRLRLYSENFDAIELFNGSRYEFIRTPTVGEVTDFVRDLDALALEGPLSEEEFSERLNVTHERSMRQVLIRTRSEQALMRMGAQLDCIVHEDCEEGLLCDPGRYACADPTPRCQQDEDCLEACIERSRCSISGDICRAGADCTEAGETCDPARECITTAQPCTDQDQCHTTCNDQGLCEPAELPCEETRDCGTQSYSCENNLCTPAYPACNNTLPCPRGYFCRSSVVAGTNGGRCFPSCSSDDECRLDEYCGASGACEAAACNIGADANLLPDEDQVENLDRPCIRFASAHSEGVVDDWFRLLNHGIAYTAMGNSDTHTLSSEIGLPRNYVMSSADAPGLIDRREVADNIRAFRVVASYGPFVEMHVNNAAIGDTVAVAGPVSLHVRVQSPSWFDVDRIEVYGNGELICDLGFASTDESRCQTSAQLALGADGHNTDIINFNGALELGQPEGDTWYVVIAMGVGDQARGLGPVYFPSMHPQLGFTEVIGQAFASFNNPLLAAVIPQPVPRAELNHLIPYAITNPIWVEVDGNGVFEPPIAIPPYRQNIPCQFAQDPQGCQDVQVMPLSTQSLGDNPFALPPEDEDALRERRMETIRRALMRLAGGGC